MGLFAFTYGAKDSLVEFLHIDNLVQAHLLAAKALQKEDSHAVCLHKVWLPHCCHDDEDNDDDDDDDDNHECHKCYNC